MIINTPKFTLTVDGNAHGYYNKINLAIRSMKKYRVAHIKPSMSFTNIFNKDVNNIYVWSWWTTAYRDNSCWVPVNNTGD